MIRLKNINLKIDRNTIFDDLDLEVKKGEKILLRMPSGAGKSTLLKTIMGYIQTNKGEIIINNISMSRKTIADIRENIAYISQNINFTEETVEEYIDLIFSFKRNSSKNYKVEELNRLLKVFKLDKSILKKSPDRLSGGEKQRIAIILVILLDKKIFLLDEVTSGLDHDLKIIVIEFLKDLDKTIIISSHDNQWLNYSEFKVMGW